MKTINWGIIGTGRIAHTFADALENTENACLKAVASRSLEKAQNFAKKHGFQKADECNGLIIYRRKRHETVV